MAHTGGVLRREANDPPTLRSRHLWLVVGGSCGFGRARTAAGGRLKEMEEWGLLLLSSVRLASLWRRAAVGLGCEADRRNRGSCGRFRRRRPWRGMVCVQPRDESGWRLW
ncbi:hypothetical protein H0E87_031120 [Populus deltoides]|uniref:Uncharacterized protein n=1 Tax=Populus deltoides TaxID=3696 RepID=A0A8T2WJG8_POPDE|nr:hypothetical protein H0E87_031120 [Populus deltoides]